MKGDEPKGTVTLDLRTYNGFGQLVAVSRDAMRCEYRYRPDGLRYSKTVWNSLKKNKQATIFQWDGQNIILEENAQTRQVKARYLRGTNLVCQVIDLSLLYYFFNAHGDVTRQAGTLANKTPLYEYDAFGNQRQPKGRQLPAGPATDGIDTDPNPFRYCGEYFDSSSGEYYLRARMYESSTGRFTSEDIAEYISVVSTKGHDIIDPLSLNRYTYCQNAPLQYTDASGNFVITASAVLIAVGIGALVGAGIGAAAGAERANANNEDVVTGAINGAVVGGVIGAVGGLVSAFLAPAVAAGSATVGAVAAATGAATGITGFIAGGINAAIQSHLYGDSGWTIFEKGLKGAAVTSIWGTIGGLAGGAIATLGAGVALAGGVVQAQFGVFEWMTNIIWDEFRRPTTDSPAGASIGPQPVYKPPVTPQTPASRPSTGSGYVPPTPPPPKPSNNPVQAQRNEQLWLRQNSRPSPPKPTPPKPAPKANQVVFVGGKKYVY